MRTQLLREGIGIVHSVIYTHEHADHIFGLDDLRLFQFYLDAPVPLFCNESVQARLEKSFDYAFTNSQQTHPGAVPSLEIHRVDQDPIGILGAQVTPIRLLHGPRFEVLGFRVGDVAYCTDVKSIPDESMARLQGLRVLVLGALRPEPHPTHMNFDEAIEILDQLKPGMTYFTHCSCNVDYEAANLALPSNVEIAYDGLNIDLNV